MERLGQLRFATAGSVDDGKSSLIGRLLYDSKSIFEDQLAAVERASQKRGSDHVELALLTDGLRAEREQNITIDVAYRYFETPRRKFIIADTPGHFQYTRNMVTGTSAVDLTVILVDAQKGVLPQSKRHAAISALLRVPAVVVAVNKMDLVGFSEARFREIEAEFRDLGGRLGLAEPTFVPISALLGDNVVTKSDQTPWYEGPTLLEHLESVRIPERSSLRALRLPVQVVLRPDASFRGFAGTVEAGSVAPGDRVRILPGGRETTIREVQTPNSVGETAPTHTPVVVTLADEIDASRGAMLVSPDEPPTVSTKVRALVTWMGEAPLRPGADLWLLHTTQRVPARIDVVESRWEVETGDDVPANELTTNEIGTVILSLAAPIFADPFAIHPVTGSFALVDVGDFRTVGAGLIQESLPDEAARSDRGFILWHVASGAEEATQALARELRSRGHRTLVLAEPELWVGLNRNVRDREEALRRIVAVAELAAGQGFAVLIAHDASDHEWNQFGTAAIRLDETSPAEEAIVRALGEEGLW